MLIADSTITIFPVFLNNALCITLSGVVSITFKVKSFILKFLAREYFAHDFNNNIYREKQVLCSKDLMRQTSRQKNINTRVQVCDFFFPLPIYGRESIVLESNYRSGDLDEFACFEAL